MRLAQASALLVATVVCGCAGLIETTRIRAVPPEQVPPPQGWLAPPVGISAAVPIAAAPASSPLQNPARAPRGDEPATSALALTEVLASVAQHYPLLLATYEEQNIAAGQRLSAEGAFDTTVRSRGAAREGTYNNENFDVLIDQATPLQGASLFAGYRLGDGSFPVYSGGAKTADGGEFRGGVLFPLLRDRPIDRRRAALRQAQITESLAEPVIQRGRIEFFRNAAKVYWNWVAAGAHFAVAENLLRLARDRQAGLEEQLRLDLIADFIVIDNRRLIYERQALLIAAERRVQQASFELSLYWRDAAGNPRVPTTQRLPPDFAAREASAPAPDALARGTEEALGKRPELTRFRLLRERTGVDLQLAENQTYPAINLALFGAQDVGGSGSTLDRTTLEAALQLELPVQRRDAQGRVVVAKAYLAQLAEQERFARDQIIAEVQDTVSSLDRSAARWVQAREERAVAQQVADLERERFEAGASNLLDVNLRELAAAAAQAKLIDALADYFRAGADYRAVVGLDGRRESAPEP